MPGPAANTRIVNGRYRFSKQDGPMAGPHRAVLSYVRDAEDEAQFEIRTTKGRQPSAASDPAPEGDEGEKAAAESRHSGADSRSHGQELDVQVPNSGSRRMDFDIPEG